MKRAPDDTDRRRLINAIAGENFACERPSLRGRGARAVRGRGDRAPAVAARRPCADPLRAHVPDERMGSSSPAPAAICGAGGAVGRAQGRGGQCSPRGAPHSFTAASTRSARWFGARHPKTCRRHRRLVRASHRGGLTGLLEAPVPARNANALHAEMRLEDVMFSQGMPENGALAPGGRAATHAGTPSADECRSPASQQRIPAAYARHAGRPAAGSHAALRGGSAETLA